MALEASDVAAGAISGAGSSLRGLTPKGQFATDHHYVAGFLLIFVGLMGIAGSLTGTLPAMIAALFEPSVLGGTGSTTSTSTTPNDNGVVPGTPDTATPAQQRITTLNHAGK